MQASKEKILSILVSVSENTEGDNDASDEYLTVNLGHKEMAMLDRMVVAARFCNGEVSVGGFPVHSDTANEPVDAIVICDQHGRLTLSVFDRVKNAWPIETVSNATLILSSLKDIYHSAVGNVTVFAPWMSDTLYVKTTEEVDELEADDSFVDLLASVMNSDDPEDVEKFEGLFVGERNQIVNQETVIPGESSVKDVFLVSGRVSGDDDDTCMLVEAIDGAEAIDKLKAFMLEEEAVFEGEEGEVPEVYINEATDLGAAIDHRLR